MVKNAIIKFLNRDFLFLLSENEANSTCIGGTQWRMILARVFLAPH